MCRFGTPFAPGALGKEKLVRRLKFGLYPFRKEPTGHSTPLRRPMSCQVPSRPPSNRRFRCGATSLVAINAQRSRHPGESTCADASTAVPWIVWRGLLLSSYAEYRVEMIGIDLLKLGRGPCILASSYDLICGDVPQNDTVLSKSCRTSTCGSPWVTQSSKRAVLGS